jgi:hypothetical protein
MSEAVKIDLEIEIENDIEVDADGILQISTWVYTSSGFSSEDEEGYEVRTPLEDIIESLMEYYSEDYSREGYGQMYAIGHELRRLSERLIAAAEHQEDLISGQGQLNFFDDEED